MAQKRRLQDRCARCNHAYSLHGNGRTPCQAGSCKGGEGGTRCPGFLPMAETEDDRLRPVPALTFQEPAVS